MYIYNVEDVYIEHYEYYSVEEFKDICVNAVLNISKKNKYFDYVDIVTYLIDMCGFVLFRPIRTISFYNDISERLYYNDDYIKKII